MSNMSKPDILGVMQIYKHNICQTEQLLIPTWDTFITSFEISHHISRTWGELLKTRIGNLDDTVMSTRTSGIRIQ